jgi:hypothetical protein
MSPQTPLPDAPASRRRAAGYPLGARKTLTDLEAAVADDQPSKAELAAFARQLAPDVAGYFDELPRHLFPGDVYRGDRPAREMAPDSTCTYRLLLGRYLKARSRPAGAFRGAAADLAI